MRITLINLTIDEVAEIYDWLYNQELSTDRDRENKHIEWFGDNGVYDVNIVCKDGDIEKITVREKK